MRATVVSAIFLLLVAGEGSHVAGMGAQAKAPNRRPGEAGKQLQVDPGVEALILDAQSAPAEFAADLLIRIAESGRVADPTYKRRLLEDAFRRAADAQRPVQRRYIGGEVDTPPGYLAYAFDLKLDALSLRCKAVKAMLSVDKRRARELFAEIPNLNLRPLGCDDALVYDVTSFYDTLAQVTTTAFTPVERSQGEHIRFAAPYLESMSSSAQVGPAAKTILALVPAPAQLEILVHSFSKALGQIPGDDRSFTYSVTRDSSFGRSLRELVETCNRQNVSSRELLSEIRSYMVRSLGDSRCSDNVPQTSPHAEFSYVNDINKALNFDPPISGDETEPAEVKTAAKPASYWRTPETRDLLLKVRKLRFGSSATPLTAVERQTQDWELALKEFMISLGAWGGNHEKSELDYFHQKSVLYRVLLELVPEGSSRDEIIREYAGFLRDSYSAVDSRIEWLYHAKFLIGQVRAERGTEYAKAMEMLHSFSDRNLWLYARAEVVLSIPPKPSLSQQKPG
ncbi:MAG TPA: hypothetical protein VF538_06470 [Pyrinomonadaceae bacterium]|jgi:hypothetical protein